MNKKIVLHRLEQRTENSGTHWMFIRVNMMEIVEQVPLDA